MRRVVVVLFFPFLLLLAANTSLRTQGPCDYDSPNRFDALYKAISRAKSCSAAARQWQKCPFGASGDGPLASLVIEKCEKDFVDKLSAAAKKRYEERMQLCSYRYA